LLHSFSYLLPILDLISFVKTLLKVLLFCAHPTIFFVLVGLWSPSVFSLLFSWDFGREQAFCFCGSLAEVSQSCATGYGERADSMEVPTRKKLPNRSACPQASEQMNWDLPVPVE
jgi:hypothetical protein